MTRNILSARGLTHAYGRRKVVENASLEVRQGEIRAIIGPNGAGKTTLFNLLSGTVDCRQGSIEFDGRDVTRIPAHRRCRLGVGRTFQVNNLFPASTVAGNIRVPLLLRAGKAWNPFIAADPLLNDEIDSLAAAVGLHALLDKRADELAYGDRRRLEIAVALAWEPKLLLLDEPACGVSITDRPALIELIRRIVRERGITAVLVEHDMDLVFAVAEAITVLHRGRIVANDTPERIANHPEVQEIYLGKEFRHA
jgi:branched-chain amino acid transport system ATP-binding protein